MWKGEEILFIEKHRYSHWKKHCGPAYVITWLYESIMFGPKAKLINNQSINEPINQSWCEKKCRLKLHTYFQAMKCKILNMLEN